MRAAQYGQAKRQGGLSLIPALWDEIDRIAKRAGVPRNQVIEKALMEAFPVSGGFQKTDAHKRKSEADEVVELP